MQNFVKILLKVDKILISFWQGSKFLIVCAEVLDGREALGAWGSVESQQGSAADALARVISTPACSLARVEVPQKNILFKIYKILQNCYSVKNSATFCNVFEI